MTIKKKILFSTSFAFVAIYIFSWILTYVYFSNILKEKAISDDKIKLHQIEQQMQYIYEDITRISQSIIIDSQIQNFLKSQHHNNSYNVMSARYTITERLRTLISLREYIQSAILIAKDGTILYNLIPFDEEYIDDKLKEEWYKNYNKKYKYYFSNPHYIGIPGNSSNVISYIVEIKDINKPEVNIGELVLNINLSYFQKFINEDTGEFNDFLWISQDNAVIFKQRTNKNLFDLSKILMESDKETNDNPITIEQKLGYVIMDRLPDTGWKFISFTSKTQLFQRVKNIFYFFAFSTLLSLLLIIIVILPIVSSITKPITTLTKVMKRVSEGNLDVRVQISSGDEIEILGNGFNKMINSLKQYIKESINHEKIKKEMEFDLLVSQIHPHFIYNVLNTAVYMARKHKNSDIAELITSLIILLQDSLDISSNELFTTLGQEVNIINHYLKIQSYRYPDKFKVIWKIDEALLGCFIPKTIIQPLVENALFHGICAMDIVGEINISALNAGDDLIITVEDNGLGIEKDKIHELLHGKNSNKDTSGVRHIGITNIRDRIKYLYGDNYGIEIESTINKGTRISIKIPFYIGK